MTQATTESINSSTNVDPKEIAKFEALASRWWDPHSEFKPLHDINPLRLNYINEKATLKSKQVIDVGCGGGILAESMAGKGATVTGIDMGEAPLNVAQIHGMESGVKVHYEKISAENMADRLPENFDIVTCMEMLEHVPDPSQTVASCSKLVKPGGDVFFSTINRNPKSFLFAIVGAEYLLRLLPRGTHEYRSFIRPSELESWARHAGLTLKNIIGMSYNPLTKQYSLGKDVDVNYLMHFVKT
ncbi:bifunctional 2-polyprenyl-6-hydroxyphenol methylase/3-demethylubiquinol 3-O-methyltransferase UbiG [Kaarinaea lacus]